MPRLAANRKDTGGESIGGKVPPGPFQPAIPEGASTVAVSWPAAGKPVIPGRAKREPGIQHPALFWIPGLRQEAHPGMTLEIHRSRNRGHIAS
jgi:hypothetical protein